jgi:hypothetical protein
MRSHRAALLDPRAFFYAAIPAAVVEHGVCRLKSVSPL